MNLTLLARGGTPVQLDRQRILWFDMKATWLLVERFGINFVQALYAAERPEDPTAPIDLQLKSMEALEAFLWIGLLADAAEHSEDLRIERVRDFITPFTLPSIFGAVVMALMRDIETPPMPGKAEAATASPAAAAKKRVVKASTSRKRSGSRSRSSAGRQSDSGR